jgi:hypothetical protein
MLCAAGGTEAQHPGSNPGGPPSHCCAEGINPQLLTSYLRQRQFSACPLAQVSGGLPGQQGAQPSGTGGRPARRRSPSADGGHGIPSSGAALEPVAARRRIPTTPPASRTRRHWIARVLPWPRAPQYLRLAPCPPRTPDAAESPQPAWRPRPPPPRQGRRPLPAGPVPTGRPG